MARLKTVGFEQRDLTADSELFYVYGNPQLITNIDSNTGLAAVWDDVLETWDSLLVLWDSSGGSLPYLPHLVRSGFYALKVAVGDFFDIRASTKGGGGYNRAYVYLENYPNVATTLMYFIRDTDDLNVVTVEIQPDGRLRVHYRNDAGSKTYLGDYSSQLQLGRYYRIELGIFGNEVGTSRTIEARVEGVRFMAETVADLSAYDGYLGLGANYGSDGSATTFDFVVDDMATNDANSYDYDVDNNSWCGDGKVVLLPPIGDDAIVKNSGWTRGGVDTGSDWGQVAAVSPPADGISYLSSNTAGSIAEVRTGNPYEVGIKPADRITVVATNVRHALADNSDENILSVYLRAGSNLPKDGKEISLDGDNWFTGDSGGRAPDVYSTDRLPESTERWTPNEVASARIGIELIDDNPATYIGGMWLIVEYVPYNTKNYTVTINGIDRTDDVKTKTMTISDKLNEVADTCGFQLYDLKGYGMPSTNDEVIVTVDGYRLFGGLVQKVESYNIGTISQYFSISCIDQTKRLDRRRVSATYTNMTDKAIIEQIIDEYCIGENISTYFVAETTTISQISFNYISVSNAIQQIADLTGCNWFVDYFGRLHYHRMTEQQAPFNITPSGSQYQQLKIAKDAQKMRNRIFVRGGTTLTTTPITESLVADGEQRVFLLAEKPHNVVVTLNGNPQTVGIKNVDDADAFDWLLSFQEKYLEAGDLTTTPTVGDIMAITYDYDVPILVSVEDSESIDSEGVFEHAIIDKQIATSEQALDRATAELTDYAQDLVGGSYYTEESGLQSGQYQRVTYANKGVDDDYIIDSVTYKSLGGGRFGATVTLTSAKQLGIIRFLLKLLQINRQVGDFNPDEQVDQLLSLSDTLNTLQDSLIEDSAGTAFKWSNDAGTTPSKAVYDLSSWS